MQQGTPLLFNTPRLYRGIVNFPFVFSAEMWLGRGWLYDLLILISYSCPLRSIPKAVSSETAKGYFDLAVNHLTYSSFRAHHIIVLRFFTFKSCLCSKAKGSFCIKKSRVQNSTMTETIEEYLHSSSCAFHCRKNPTNIYFQCRNFSLNFPLTLYTEQWE